MSKARQNDKTTTLSHHQPAQRIHPVAVHQSATTSSSSAVGDFGVHDQRNDHDHHEDEDDYPIVENAMVEVLPRTWPGINKIGGIARVTKCHYATSSCTSNFVTSASSSKLSQSADRNEEERNRNASSSSSESAELVGNQSYSEKLQLTHVDVRYVVMGGREKMVPLEYCKPAPQYDHQKMILVQGRDTYDNNSIIGIGSGSTGNGHPGHQTSGALGEGLSSKRKRLNLRDRSSLLGRCKLCGSLRSDCGSCDWVAEERKRLELQQQQQLVTEQEMNYGGAQQQYKRRKRRKNGKLDQELKKSKGISLEEDSMSFEGSNDYQEDGGDDDDDDDESFTLYNRRSSRNKLVRFLASSSSDSSADATSLEEEDDDESSSEDDQILATLNELSSSMSWKRIKQRMKQISKLSNHDDRNKRKKRLQLKYMQKSDAKFRRRMKFLNQRLEKNVSRRRQQQEEKRNVASQLSVLEQIGKPKPSKEHIPQEKDKMGLEVEDVPRKKRKRDRQNIPIQSFRSQLYVDDDDNEGISQESIEMNPIGDNQNQGINLRIGFVDGDDIGEEESDEDNNVQEEGDEEFFSMDNDTRRLPPTTFKNDDRMDAIKGYYENDGLGMNSFIQPEGELVAENLPFGVLDKSKNVPFSELPTFFDGVVNDLTKVHVPKYEACVVGIEKEFDTVYTRLQRGNGSVDNNLLKIQKQCREMYNEMCVVLVRDGTDQCRCALKRFGKKKEYRIANHKLPKNEWKELVENLDLKFDALDDEVESLLQRARSILLECSDAIEFYSECSKDCTKGVISKRNRRQSKIQGNSDVGSSSRTNIKHQHASRSKKYTSETWHMHSQMEFVTKKRTRREPLNRNESNVHSFDSSEYVNSNSNSRCEDLYDDLNKSLRMESMNSTPAENKFPTINDLIKYCESLSDAYPAESCFHLLEELPLCFDQPHLSSENLHGAAVTVFSTLLSLLGLFAGHSFQEMIAIKCQEIVSHLKLFSCVFRLRRRQVHLYLKPSDAVIHKVFGGRHLQDNLLLQIIDVLYALLLPKQWGAPSKISSKAYSLLCEIRDEMGCRSHLTEEFANAIIKFPCQTWRKTSRRTIAKQSWYVSSVDPTDLEIILRGDTPLGGNAISRLSLMKKNCPRREINAIWGMFAWFSRRTESPNMSANVRWRLLSSLFTYQAGSLSHCTGTRYQLPPNHSHLTCLQDEFKRVEILLRSGGMEPLPNDDGILGSILFRALLLYGQSEHYLDIRNISKPTSQSDSMLAFDVWKESDISYLIEKESSSRDFISRRLVTEYIELTIDDTTSQFSLLSSGYGPLRTVFSFLKGWLERVTKKKARWSRLGDTMSKVADKLLNISLNGRGDHNQQHNEQRGDVDVAFSSMFPSVVEDPIHESSHGAGLKCMLTNAVVHMFVLVIESLSKSGVEVDANFPIKLDLSFCKKVWKSIADHSLQQRQCHLMAQCSFVQNNMNHTGSIGDIYIAMKTVSLVLLSILEEIECKVQIEADSCDQDIKSTAESQMAYMLTCMLTLVTYNSDYLRESARKLFPGPMVSMEYNSQGLRLTNLMASGLFWLSCIVHRMTFILHKNQSRKGPSLTLLKGASNHFIPRAFQVILECLKAIPSCAMEKSSSGTCYRSCLSLLRNTINLFWLCHKLNTIREASSPDKDRINQTSSAPHISSHDEELFGGINDDVLMSINLDSLVDKDASFKITESTHLDIESCGAKEIWNILVETIDKAKPSQRFKIDKMPVNVTPCEMEFTHQGKAVCALHAAGICGVISSFCAVREANDTIRDNLNSIIELRVWQNAMSTSIENDHDFFRDVIRCICIELCHIAKYSTNCTELIGGLSSGIILRTFIRSIANASTLNIFPSTNKRVLVEIGGKESSAIEERLILKTLKKVKNHKSIGPDGGHLVDQYPSDYFDAPGPNYMASHFWSFCNDLGALLQSTHKDSTLNHEALVFKRIGMALLTSDYDLDPSLQKILNEALESMSQFSLERECFRRIVKLRSIISACFANEADASLTANHELNHPHRNADFDILSTVISSLIEELIYLVTGVEYYENNPLSVKPHTKAKIHALFHAYSHLTSSSLTWLLSHSSTVQVKGLCDLLLRYFLLPVLRCRGFYNAKDVFRAAGITIKENVSKVIESGAPSPSPGDQIPLNILLFALTRYMDRIVDYACFSQEDHNLYQILTCFEASDPEKLQKNTFIPTAFVESIERRFSKSELNLIGSIDLYFSLAQANYTNMSTRKKTSIKRFRIFAIRSFILPKLKHESIRLERKANLLLILLRILDVQNIEKYYDIPKPLYISIENDDDECFLSLDLDVAEIVSVIFIALNSSFIARNINSQIINYSFKCIRCLFTMNITGDNSCLMAWCIANQEKSYIASKLQDYMRVFFLLSRILTSQELNFIVEHYETMNVERKHLFEKYKCMVSNIIPKNDHTDLDQVPNPQNHYKTQNTVPQPTIRPTEHNIDEDTRAVLLSFQSSFTICQNRSNER